MQLHGLHEAVIASEALIHAAGEDLMALKAAIQQHHQAVQALRDACPHEVVIERCDDGEKGCDGGAGPDGHPHWRICPVCGRQQQVWLGGKTYANGFAFAENRVRRIDDLAFWEAYDQIPGRVINDSDLSNGFDFFWEHYWD